ncbi:MAG TPA: Hsp20/alpha crystallin family protein [Ktedonobacteraceae bacterium]|nr:Hsp20/alpha crystallin family protein [Ktedonobacteraceae bacterium]
MQEQLKQQSIPLKVYRTKQRVMIAAAMPGLEPENIVVEVTADGNLVLHGELRGRLKGIKELLLDEWSAGVYHREMALIAPVNAECANVTYGNGVLLIALPLSDRTRPARLTLERVTPTHGQRTGNAGHPPACRQA